MRKIKFQVMISLDGYFEGPDRDISWHTFDTELQQHSIDMLTPVDTMLYGRVIYELMEDYWPKAETLPEVTPGDHQVARLMNRPRKIVYSKTLTKLDNPNASLRNEVDPDEIRTMKQEIGGDIGVGGSMLAAELARHGLIDEFHIIVAPVFIGKGRTLFDTLHAPLNLRLVNMRRFQNGNVELTYLPG